MSQSFRSRIRRLRLETLHDRINPVVVSGTPGNDIITSQLLFHVGENSPYAADILVNGVAKGQVQITGQWNFPSTSYFIDQDLTLNGLGGNDRIEVGLLRPQDIPGAYTHVNGGAGRDTLVGGNGHDDLDGGAGADDMFGGIDEDTLTADMADVRLIGGGGQDTLVYAASGIVRLTNTSLIANGTMLSEANDTFAGFFSIVLNGSAGSDSFDASQSGGAAIELHGNGGNDFLSAGGSRATVDGGAGNDVLIGSASDDLILGGAGKDLLYGGDDLYPDFTGNRLDGGAGNDTMIGGTGFNTLLGDKGNDVLFGGPRNDALYGEEGDDSLSGGGGSDFLYGDGDETLMPPTYSGDDSLDGGSEDDVLVGDSSDEKFVGGDGFDSLTVEGIRGKLVLTDTTWKLNNAATRPSSGLELVSLTGSPQNDTLDVSGYGGLANLRGVGGNDTLKAGPGGGTLEGGSGADALFGGTGYDELYGDAADKSFNGGGGGSDFVVVNDISGAAILTDTQLTINGRAIPLIDISGVALYGSDNADTLDASACGMSVSLYGMGGNDILKGSTGNSYLSGGDGDDSIVGAGGNDTLYGDAGLDTLNAGGGDDYLDGGEDLDLLTGGLGADQFVQDVDSATHSTELSNSDFNILDGDTEV